MIDILLILATRRDLSRFTNDIATSVFYFTCCSRVRFENNRYDSFGVSSIDGRHFLHRLGKTANW